MRNKVLQNKRLQAIVLFVGTLILLAKFYAWYATHSNAILTDALESCINVVAGIFALYSLYLAALPKDENHPYGHGKVEFLSIGIEGGLIFFAGLAIILKSIYNLFYPEELHVLDLGILIVVVSGMLNFMMGWLLVYYGKRNESLVLVADGKHLLSDGYTSIGLLVGLALVRYTQIAWIDSATAILMGVYILYTGWQLLRSSISGIMDETDLLLLEELVQKMETQKNENWIDVHNFRVIRYGSNLHIDSHLTLPWYFNQRQAHDEVKRFEALLNAREQSNPVELFTHVDPCEPPLSCKICAKRDCPLREQPFTFTVTWTLANILEDKKHYKDL